MISWSNVEVYFVYFIMIYATHRVCTLPLCIKILLIIFILYLFYVYLK